MTAILMLAWIFMHVSYLLLVLMIYWYKGVFLKVKFSLIKVQGFFSKIERSEDISICVKILCVKIII